MREQNHKNKLVFKKGTTCSFTNVSVKNPIFAKHYEELNLVPKARRPILVKTVHLIFHSIYISTRRPARIRAKPYMSRLPFFRSKLPFLLKKMMEVQKVFFEFLKTIHHTLFEVLSGI